jgi:hypothetical protein
MKKLANLTAYALLASLTGCAGAVDQDASKDVGEATQASTSAGTWSGLPIPRQTAETISCAFQSGSGHQNSVSINLTSSSTALTPASAAFSGASYSGSANGSGASLSAGQTEWFTDAHGSYFELVAGADSFGNLTVAIQNGYFSYDGSTFTCAAELVAPTATALDVLTYGQAYNIGQTFTGYYVFSDTVGLPEKGSTYQWFRVSGSTSTAIAGATSTTYVAACADVGDALEFCVVPADANGPGTQVCSAPTTGSIAPASASASNVGIQGLARVGDMLTGSYTFADADGLAEKGSTYQWYHVAGGTSTLISGATSVSYTPQSTDVNQELAFCVTPADAIGPGCPVCSSPVTVAGVVWYSGESWTGTATGETYTNGACVNVSSLHLGYTPASLALYAQASTTTYIYMFTGSNCTGSEYQRLAGAGTVHDINLDTVGIGSNLVSYQVAW